jgi:chromosome segregation ATPase
MVEGPAQRDREWSHWPGRRAPDERSHGRLRSLFAATDEGEETIEQVIAAKGRELEERTERLVATVSDLERREEQARELQAAVETMLREGSAELDARHAELTALAAELTRRDAELAAKIAELEERRTELGAVELRRAAVERREEALAQRVAEVERARDELAARIDAAPSAEDVEAERTRVAVALEAARVELEAREALIAELERRLDEAATAALPAHRVDAHVAIVPGGGYRIVEREGAPPEAGDEVEVDGARYRVTRVGFSPLPGDDRRCAFLEAVA